MPTFNLFVTGTFTKKHATNPAVPDQLNVDVESLILFKQAGFDVSFTGIVFLPQARIFLNPLVATRAGNQDISVLRKELHSSTAGDLEGRYQPQSILHPNLTPQLRAQRGLASGHHQICTKHGFAIDDCIGFALTKGEASKMTINSRTLNSDKFLVDPVGIEKLPANLRKFYGQPQISDGGLTKEWAFAIAALLERVSGLKCETNQGNFEAHF